jgi:hypothetical protein
MPDDPGGRSGNEGDGIDAALGLVCTLPPLDLAGRRVGVQYLLDRSTAWHEQEEGVQIDFDGTTEIVRALLDFALAEVQCCPQFTYDLTFASGRVTLGVRAGGSYIVPLKTMYGGLARQAGVHERT